MTMQFNGNKAYLGYVNKLNEIKKKKYRYNQQFTSSFEKENKLIKDCVDKINRSKTKITKKHLNSYIENMGTVGKEVKEYIMVKNEDVYKVSYKIFPTIKDNEILNLTNSDGTIDKLKDFSTKYINTKPVGENVENLQKDLESWNKETELKLKRITSKRKDIERIIEFIDLCIMASCDIEKEFLLYIPEIQSTVNRDGEFNIESMSNRVRLIVQAYTSITYILKEICTDQFINYNTKSPKNMDELRNRVNEIKRSVA